MAIELSEKQIKDGWQMVEFGEIAKQVKSTTKDPAEDGLEFYVGLEHLDPQSLRIARKGIIAEDIYSDRLEIISPGSLQNSMTVEKMLAGQRYTRNAIIMEIMRDYGYVDFRGMGLRIKVVPLMRSRNGCDPIFEATEDYLKVTLPRRSGAV